MEGAVFVAALATTLVRVKRAREATPTERRREQWVAGAWGAALVLLRPETVVLIPLLAVTVARRALSQSAAGAVARTGGPAALATLTVLGVNLARTGDAPSAGALAKLLTYHPFLTDIDRAHAAIVNLVHFALLIRHQLGHGTALAILLPCLCVPALVCPRTRGLAVVCVAGAAAWTLLVSWNDAARFQNFRYYMPALALGLLGSALGLAALARTRVLAGPGILVAIAGMGLAASGLLEQSVFFSNASANVHDQQVEVGRRLARLMPETSSILVGDAGAIPYVADRHAVDALGLGGYRGLPFARASALGEGAIVELIERVPPRDRPAFMALYPSWFGAITRTFGREVDHVSLDRNYICGALTKVIYVADWSALADVPGGPLPAGAVADTLDVADVVSERDHRYVSPEPLGGWTSLDIRNDDDGARLFDAGRTIPEGQSERFELLADVPSPATVLVRTDEADVDVDASVAREAAAIDRIPLARHGSATATSWGKRSATFRVALRRGDVIAIHVLRGTFRDFHVWVVSGE
jgi:hypothetical protein